MMQTKLNALRKQIQQACKRAGRKVEDVTLVAVSKKQSATSIMEAYKLGLRDFGENYMQEMAEKMKVLPRDIRWHFVGNLQSKKIKYVSERVHMVHSLDRSSQIKAWRKLQEEGQPLPKLLIQLNVSGEGTKNGIAPNQLPDFWQQCAGLPVVGLMSFPAYDPNPAVVRPYFAQTREAWAKLETGHAPVLSMGVSSDFEVAIEEGATHIRVGTQLFGRR
jgi:pyridoxal phosphate enzyme (YggS family)